MHAARARTSFHGRKRIEAGSRSDHLIHISSITNQKIELAGRKFNKDSNKLQGSHGGLPQRLIKFNKVSTIIIFTKCRQTSTEAEEP